jgi:hypothetical protein
MVFFSGTAFGATAADIFCYRCKVRGPDQGNRLLRCTEKRSGVVFGARTVKEVGILRGLLVKGGGAVGGR